MTTAVIDCEETHTLAAGPQSTAPCSAPVKVGTLPHLCVNTPPNPHPYSIIIVIQYYNRCLNADVVLVHRT